MGEMVTYPVNGRTASGYLALPTEPAPGVVVIQEWWGLVPHIKDIADRLAAAGYAALAPDLYDGAATTEPDEAGKMMMALRVDEAARAMGGAVDHLVAHPAVTGAGVGVVGFCMGGGLTLLLGTSKPEVRAAVPFYGGLWEGVSPDFTQGAAAYLGHYAEHDEWATPEVAADLERRARQAGLEATFHVYPGTQHAFFNDERPEVYDADAAGLAWQRTLDFFAAQL